MLQLFIRMCAMKPAPNVTYFSQNKSFIMHSHFCCSKWTKICAIIWELGHILPFNGEWPASLFQRKNNAQNYPVQTINKRRLHINAIKWSPQRESHSYRYKCCFQQWGKKKKNSMNCVLYFIFALDEIKWKSTERHRRMNILFLASCLVLIARALHIALFCTWLPDCGR